MSIIKFQKGVTVTTFPPTPSWFDPLKADNVTLLRHGYPPRPDNNPELLKQWKQLMKRPLLHIESSFERTEKRHMPRLSLTGTNTSTNWSGAEVIPPTGATFTWLTGQWIAPNPDPITNDGTMYYCSSWIGIDGDNGASDRLFQTGTGCEVVTQDGAVQRNIYAWFEWFPDYEVKISDFPVSGGDVLTCVVWVMLPYQTFIIETGTTFGPETDGVWMLGDYDHDGIPDLVFIKTSNVRKVEVHVASGASKYQTLIFETETAFDPETDGVWLLTKGETIPNLVFIKTSNTSTGTVEVHIATGVSNYQEIIHEPGSTFGTENDGVWLMGNYYRDHRYNFADLVFIKTRNVRKVEVHVASALSNYQTRVFEAETIFDPGADGEWILVENGYTIPDLVFIKTKNTGTGSVEIHVASGESKYQNLILETGTAYPPWMADWADGRWLFTDYNNDKKLDLVFIKAKNTGTGTVEVHAANGDGSDTDGYVYLINETKGIATSFKVSAPSKNLGLIGNCAEWIVERPLVDNTLTKLANYGYVPFKKAHASATGTRNVNSSAGNNVNMVDDSGNIISTGTVSSPDNVTCNYKD